MFVIAYDIHRDKTRTKVAKILKDYGLRVQFSVFESDYTKAELEEPISKIKRMIDKKTDSIRVYQICKDCKAKSEIIGLDKCDYYPDSLVI